MTAFELLERNTLLSDEQKKIDRSIDRSTVVEHGVCARNTAMKIIISRTHLSDEAFSPLSLPLPSSCQASARHIRPFDFDAIRGNHSIARLLILIGQIQNERERHCLGSFVDLIIFIAFRSFSSSPFQWSQNIRICSAVNTTPLPLVDVCVTLGRHLPRWIFIDKHPTSDERHRMIDRRRRRCYGEQCIKRVISIVFPSIS